jgi:Zn-dependent metalloprotease
MRFRSFVLAVCILAILLPCAGLAGNKKAFRVLIDSEAEQYEIPVDLKKINSRNKDGIKITRYQQLYDSKIPVQGAQITIRRDKLDDKIYTVIGSYYPDLIPTNEISLSEQDAIAVATSFIPEIPDVSPEASVLPIWESALEKAANSLSKEEDKYTASLMIEPESCRYFYYVENKGRNDNMIYWVDAENGNIIKYYNPNPNAVCGIDLFHCGFGVNGDTKLLQGLTILDGSDYLMRDISEKLAVFDCKNMNDFPLCSNSLASDDDDAWVYSITSSPGHPAMVDAQYYADKARAYYRDVHDFKFNDEYDNGIKLYVHYDPPGTNTAFWDNKEGAVVLADGDQIHFREFSGSLEVLGHELGHAIIDKLIPPLGFVYDGESGALDEAFADIMGTSIEFSLQPYVADWTIGEDIGIGGTIKRNMKNTVDSNIYHGSYIFTCDHPSHHGDILRLKTGEGNDFFADNQFVHHNSTIVSHWFYLLVEGCGDNPSDPDLHPCNGGPDVELAAIDFLEGIDGASKFVYNTYSDLTPGANICNLRETTIGHARTYYGNYVPVDEPGTDPPEYPVDYLSDAVEDAWDDVGVTAELCGPPIVEITTPPEGWMVGGSEVVIRGHATDIGGIKLKMHGAIAGSKEILYKIKAAADENFTSFCTDDCLSMKGSTFARPEVCSANEPDPQPDECRKDYDSVCMIEIDPECPDVGFLATFDSEKYVDRDYTLRVIARDYQGNETYFDRAITIDNVNFIFSDDFESGDTSVWNIAVQ